MPSCPICGAEELTRSVRKRQIPVEFGREITIDETIYSCAECEMEGDFFNENDRKVDAALELYQKKFAGIMIDELAADGISMAYFERAMSLPIRTLARWKRGGVSAPGYALVKTVKTFPWVLDVAAKRFDHDYAMDRMLAAATDELGRRMKEKKIIANGSIVADVDTLDMKMTFKKELPIMKNQYQVQEVIGQ